jgi:hypothetical protein
MNANHRSQRTPRARHVCILRQWRGAAAAERWAYTMLRVTCSLLLLLCLAGCTQRPPSPVNGKLPKEALTWYEHKAVSWFEEQREAHRQGHHGTFILGMDERDYDQTIPVKRELSKDQATVTVSLPKRVTKFEEEWITIDVDTRSGRVRTTGMQVVNKDYFK